MARELLLEATKQISGKVSPDLAPLFPLTLIK